MLMKFNLVLFQLVFIIIKKNIFICFIGNGRQFNHLSSADQETQKSARIYTNNNDINAALNELSQLNGNQDVSEPWIVDNAVGQTARLQANGISENIEKKQRRNDVLFLGKYFLT